MPGGSYGGTGTYGSFGLSSSTQGLLNAEEIIFYGYRLPIDGPIQEQLVSIFPGKIVIGDATRADDPLAASYVMNDYTGGLLRKRVQNVAVDTNRFAWSTGTTLFNRQWTLGEATRNLGAAGLTSKDVRCGAEFRDQQYVVFDNQLVRVQSDETLVTVGAALPTNATDMIVYRNVAGPNAGTDRLVIAYKTGYATYDGTTLATVATAALYFQIWDDKLVKIDDAGLVTYATDVTHATPWIAGGLGGNIGAPNVVALPTSSFTGMMIYPNALGDDALHVATKEGLYFYDESSQKFRRTRLNLPRLRDNGIGSTVWRDVLYFNSGGLAVHRWTGATVDQVGLDRDDGLPADFRGNITKLAPSLSYLMAATESLLEVPLGSPIFTGKIESMAPAFFESRGYSAIYARTDTAWHPWVTADQAGTGCKWVGASTADNRYRLFYGMNNSLYAMDLHPDVYNVLDNTVAAFRLTGELVTPWTDLGWSEVPKLANAQETDVDFLGTCTGDPCQVSIYYGKNDDEAWFPVTTIVNGDPDSVVKYGADGLGEEFSTIRFRYVATRCENVNHTPVLRGSTLTFFKRIAERWGKRITIDGTKAFGTMQAEDIVSLMKFLASPSQTPRKGKLKCFVDGVLAEEDVLVTGLSITVAPGTDQRGLCHLSVVSV